MSRDYIPHCEDGAAFWMRNFCDSVRREPERFRLTESDADEIAVAVDEFEARRNATLNDFTRTRPAIAAKNEARAAAERVCRGFAMQIKRDSDVADIDKINIGVRPKHTRHEPIDPPRTFPLLRILGNPPGSQVMRYADSVRPDSSAKPFGAEGLDLFIALTDREPGPLSAAEFLGKYTRNPIVIEFTDSDDGKIATYYARWSNAKGETGPWSQPISMRIAA